MSSLAGNSSSQAFVFANLSLQLPEVWGCVDDTKWGTNSKGKGQASLFWAEISSAVTKQTRTRTYAKFWCDKKRFLFRDFFGSFRKRRFPSTRPADLWSFWSGFKSMLEERRLLPSAACRITIEQVRWFAA